MKILKSMIMAFILAYTFVACKKDDSTPNPSSSGLAGVWQGKWGDINQEPQNFIKFDIKANGTLTRLDEQNQVIATGTWVLNGVEFECTYTHSSDGQVHKIGGLYTDFNGEIIGTWGYSPSKADGGTIELKKQ